MMVIRFVAMDFITKPAYHALPPIAKRIFHLERRIRHQNADPDLVTSQELPRQPTGRRRPTPQDLSQHDGLPYVIAIVGSDGLQHLQPTFPPAVREQVRAARSLVERRESFAKIFHCAVPFFLACRTLASRPTPRGMLGKRRRLSLQPLDYPVLPVVQVIQQLKKRVRRALEPLTCELPIESFKNVLRFGVGALSRQRAPYGFFQNLVVFGHDFVDFPSLPFLSANIQLTARWFNSSQSRLLPGL